MTTHTMDTNTNFIELPEKTIIAGYQKAVKENPLFRVNEGINPCPIKVNRFEVSI